MSRIGKKNCQKVHFRYLQSRGRWPLQIIVVLFAVVVFWDSSYYTHMTNKSTDFPIEFSDRTSDEIETISTNPDFSVDFWKVNMLSDFSDSIFLSCWNLNRKKESKKWKKLLTFGRKSCIMMGGHAHGFRQAGPSGSTDIIKSEYIGWRDYCSCAPARGRSHCHSPPEKIL